MATYAIGDVQGCYRELRLLLQKVSFNPSKDKLWFVGDLVNRGPDSLSVLRFVKALGKRAIVVLGNHDLHLLAVHFGEQTPRASDTFNEVLKAQDREDLMNWLRTRKILHRSKKLGFCMTHAGIPIIWSEKKARALAKEVQFVLRSNHCGYFFRHMYGNYPSFWTDSLQGMARLRVITNYFTRMRLINGIGELELVYKGGVDELPDGFIPWFCPYREKPPKRELIFGHWAALNGKTNVPRVHALDTGCVWGRSLTAMRLEDKKRFSVSAQPALT